MKMLKKAVEEVVQAACELSDVMTLGDLSDALDDPEPYLRLYRAVSDLRMVQTPQEASGDGTKETLPSPAPSVVEAGPQDVRKMLEQAQAEGKKVMTMVGPIDLGSTVMCADPEKLVRGIKVETGGMTQLSVTEINE